MNFDESWHALYAANVDLVFWPSAYGGGLPMRGYAQAYHYNIAAAGWGEITDITGQVTRRGKLARLAAAAVPACSCAPSMARRPRALFDECEVFNTSTLVCSGTLVHFGRVEAWES